MDKFRITQTQWTNLISDIGIIKSDLKKVDKTINGNGQPGLIQNMNKTCSRLDKIEGGYKVLAWFCGSGALLALVALIKTIICRLFLSE